MTEDQPYASSWTPPPASLQTNGSVTAEYPIIEPAAAKDGTAEEADVEDGFAGQAGYFGTPGQRGFHGYADGPVPTAAALPDGSSDRDGERSGGRHLQPETEPAPPSMFTPRNNTGQPGIDARSVELHPPTPGAAMFSPPGHVTSRNASATSIDRTTRDAMPDTAAPAAADVRTRSDNSGPLELRAAAGDHSDDLPDDPLAPRVYIADEDAQRRWAETHLRTADPGRSGVAELRTSSAMPAYAVNGQHVNGRGANGHVGPNAAVAVPGGRAGLRVAFSPMAQMPSTGLLPASPEPAMQIDYGLVTVLQAEVSRLVIEALRGEPSVTNDHRRAITRELTDAVVRRNIDIRVRSGETGPVTWPGYERALSEAVNAYLTGLGRLQPLIDDPDVENVMVLGTRVRVVYANGVIDETTFTAAASDEELISLLQRLAERGGKTERSLSSAKPILHLRLPDGARLTVIYMVTSRPVVVIRRHRIKDVSLDDMVRMDAITPTVKAFLEAAIAAHMNIMIAGRANSGKTTLLRAIADEIPREEWFAVMETVGELGLDSTGRHPWAVCFEEREGFGEKSLDGRPEGQLSIDDLFPHMLRLSTNRIIVGEVRAEEIVAMFDAMNTTYGSLCTIHSRDEHGVFDRLAELLLRYGASKSREGAYLTIGNALDFVVYVNMEEYPGRRPRRYVSSIMEVHGLGEGTQLARSRIFAPGPTGMAVPTGVRPSERRALELQRAGLDMRVLLNAAGAYQAGDGR
jgi:type IV secretory pathway ATPase VirB11/archaellum biosynthesis ATPase